MLFLVFCGFNLLCVDVRVSYMQMLTTEVVVGRCSIKELFSKILLKSWKKKSVPESNFNKVVDEGLQLYWKET